MNVYSNILDMVGKTPMLELTHIDTGPCRLFLKLELMNPGGSIKDRIGISMIEQAERRGDIKPGDTLVEATAGKVTTKISVGAKLYVPPVVAEGRLYVLTDSAKLIAFR